MTDHYVFQLQFVGTELREKQFVIVDGGSMADYSKLREDLGKCTPEAFVLQYIDDEDDIVSIDTEDEFKEFAKLAKKRASKGMMIKLILNSVIPLERENYWQVPSREEIAEIKEINHKEQYPQSPKKIEPEPCNVVGDSDLCFCSTQMPMKEVACARSSKKIEPEQCNVIGDPEVCSCCLCQPIPTKEGAEKGIGKAGVTSAILTDELKLRMKSEIMDEIMAEMRRAIKTAAKNRELGAEYDEDSEGSIVPEKRKPKLLSCQKKLEKKEKLAETKIDQRIEKLEMKKKKLLEKASLRSSVGRKPVMDMMVGLPLIMSGIQIKETLTVTKIVTVGKVFLHVWQIINDGTMGWANVELRHTWSSPGLDPEEKSVKCLPLRPGQVDQIAMKFKAPKTIGTFISYWHLFYQHSDSQWQQFGHFVSVSGSTKSSKLVPYASAKTQDAIEKLHQESIKFVTKSEIMASSGVKPKLKIVNEEPEISFKKQLEVSLASAQIAAEMAREAARAAKRQAGGLQMADNIKTNDIKQMDKRLDEAVTLVQNLNLGESSSDTDGNVDTSEETDPGFVMLDIPCCFVSEKETQEQAKTAQVKVAFDQSDSVKEINIMPSKINNENNTPVPPAAGNTENQEADVDKVVESAEPCNKNEQENQKVPSVNNSEMPVNQEPFEIPALNDGTFILEEVEQPMSYPRLDPNMNYPVFPPPVSVMYPPQQAVPHQHPPHGYPVFPPQNPASHSLMFPPAPMIHFSTPKMNPVHYSQLPTYPPASCRPMPLISTGMPPPPSIPPPVIPPASQMPPCMPRPPPQINPPPMHAIHGPYPFIQPPNYNTIHQSPPATVVSCESNTHPATNSTLTPAFNHVAETTPENTPLALTKKITETQSEAQPKPVESNKKADSTVQILPQALVDGAINVAASAYSTAWNALNNLRPKEGEATEFDPVFENNMALLVEMGFNNLERNARLLKRFNNDISQVIGVICATGGGHDLNID